MDTEIVTISISLDQRYPFLSLFFFHLVTRPFIEQLILTLSLLSFFFFHDPHLLRAKERDNTILSLFPLSYSSPPRVSSSLTLFQ